MSTGAPRQTVLVVDDNPAARDSLALYLAAVGYQAVTAADGRQALDYLRDNPPPYLIVLDLMMPAMDGFEFLRVRREESRLRTIPVLVLSGVADLKREALAGEVLAVEAKPVAIERLLQVLSDLRPRSATTNGGATSH